MKKNIILAVVVVVTLALAGTSGVFATWSDSEISMDNVIKTGSVDLKVNGADDTPWGTGVPRKVFIDCMTPCKWYGPFEVELWNAGQCKEASKAFFSFKDMCCSNVPPKINPYPDGGSAYWPKGATTGYACKITGDLKPEPELVAEFGGKVDCKTVPGIGRTGDDCSLKSHVGCMVTADEAGRVVLVKETKLINLAEQTYLFDLEPCNAKTIYLWFKLQQPSEEEYGFNFFPNPGQPGYDRMMYLKFNDWPSWAYMKDMVSFSLEFSLWLEHYDSVGSV